MLSLLHDATMGLQHQPSYFEWLLLIIENWYQPQCQGMLIPTAFLHNQNALKRVVAVPEDTAVIKPTEVQEPMRCSDLAAQSADVARIDLASRWLWTMRLPHNNGYDVTVGIAWSYQCGTEALHAD